MTEPHLREVLDSDPGPEWAQSLNGHAITDLAETFALTAHDFAHLEEPEPVPLLGSADMNILPQHGLAILAGKAGGGKTTLTLDLAFALASGLPWPAVDVDKALHPIECARPLSVLLIENEGPPAMFRKKLRAKIESWSHPIVGQIWVQTWRWGSFSFQQTDAAVKAGAFLEEHNVDLVIGDPLASLGLDGVGSPKETREFLGHLKLLGLWNSRSFFFLHHFRKDPADDDIDQLQGAWGGHLDTLMVLKATASTDQLRLSFPKLRWAMDERKPMLLGKVRATASFEYLGDEGDPRVLEPSIVELLRDGVWRTAPEISRKDSGVGARRDAVKQCLESNAHLFRSVSGDVVGRSAKAVCWQLVDAATPTPPDSSEGTGRVGTSVLEGFDDFGGEEF